MTFLQLSFMKNRNILASSEYYAVNIYMKAVMILGVFLLYWLHTYSLFLDF